MRSGMMNAQGVPTLPSAYSIFGNGCLRRRRKLLSSTASIASSRALIIWPMLSRTIQRCRLAMQSAGRTGSLSWNFRPERSLNVQVRPSEETSEPSHICGFGTRLLSTPYSVSKNSSEALRTT